MEGRNQADESDPRHEDEARPKYVMPQNKQRSYQDFTNEGPGEPVYDANTRGYEGRG